MLRSDGKRRGPRWGIGGALALVAALAVGLVASPGANARGLKTGFIDQPMFTAGGSTRATWLDHAKNARAGLIRINVQWREVVGSKPLTPTNPADPSYHFGSLDSAIGDARARGFDVMLTV